MQPSARIFSAASERNRDPILDVLREIVPESAFVLEIGCGPGMHAAWFAKRLPGVTWQPTDLDPAALASTEVWRTEADCPGLLGPIRLDVRERPWPIPRADVVYSANVIHISPWDCTVALVEGASEVLAVGGRLILYGPFRLADRPTAPSNEQFDQTLRSRDPSWGIRALESVTEIAEQSGLVLRTIRAMPANNLTVVYERAD